MAAVLAHALGVILHLPVGVPDGGAVVLDGRGEVPGKDLRAMEMPEISWFLDHFSEAFGLTLDGLQRM